MHVLDSILPGLDTAFVWHGKHSPGPARALNVPAAHSVHGPPSGPEKPGSHRQASAATLPGSDAELAGHAEQAADPASDLY